MPSLGLMHRPSAYPRVRTLGQLGDYKMGRANLKIFHKDRGNLTRQIPLVQELLKEKPPS